VGANDVAGAVAEVSKHAADAVFVPIGQQKGLAKIIDAPSVPNPAFVQFASKLPAAVAGKVAKAVTGFGGTGAISGWAPAGRGEYAGLRGRMGVHPKNGVATPPDFVRNDAKDVLKEPGTLDEVDLAPVEQHIEAPPGRLE
jgi:hypothetical protein